MADEIQKTIDDIDETIEENTLEQPLSKGVATQHVINQRPREMSPETYAILMGESDAESGMREMTFVSHTRDGQAVQLRRSLDISCVNFGINPSALLGATEAMRRFAETLAYPRVSVSERCRRWRVCPE